MAVTALLPAAAMMALPVAAAASVTWSASFSPPPRSGYEVDGFAARSAADVWAVGLRPGGRCQFQTLTLHWDGSVWTVIPSPGSTAVNSVLDGVTVAGANQAWAVGTEGCPADQSRTLTERWNGSAWSIVASPNGGVTGNRFSTLQAVTAISASDVWAVGGQAGIRNHAPVTVPLIEHWNGTRWQVVHAPPVGGPGALSSLSSVDAAPGTRVWAVGFWLTGAADNSVVLHWTGTAWKQETTPAFSNLFRVAVLPNNELFTSDHGTIFLGQPSG